MATWEQQEEIEREVRACLRQYPRLTRARLIWMLEDARDFGRLNAPNAVIAWEHFLTRTLPSFDELPLVSDDKTQGKRL